MLTLKSQKVKSLVLSLFKGVLCVGVGFGFLEAFIKIELFATSFYF